MTTRVHRHDARAPGEPRRLAAKRISAYAGIAALAAILACLLFPDLFINPFLSGRMTRALGEAFPGYTTRIAGLRYNVWANRLRCDSISVIAGDSTPVFSASGIEITGMGRLPLLFGEGITPGGVGDVRAEARDVALTVARSGHVLQCAGLTVSIPDSSLTIDDLRYQPPADDDRFFAGSEFRRTRYRLVVPQVRVTGLAWVTPGNGCRAGAVNVQRASLSVLIDREKPVNAKAARPVLPVEMLRAIGMPLQIDSVLVVNGWLEYQERFDAGSVPAVMTFDGIQIAAEGIGNAGGRDDTAHVDVRATLMGACPMSMRMAVPMASPAMSFGYSGSMGELDVRKLNPFVEVSEGIRLKTGILHSASFDIDVTAGKAVGTVRAAYKDLKVVAIDSRTGSESDAVDTFVSIVANNIVLRTTNMPDDSGNLKTGSVGYERTGDETFVEFAWFALRSGISDLAGL